ncbi:MAG TPA: tetratricopeptide repeat protein [Candidatus Cloacimonetes bacterium]|nr:tetratricopeptide repeat protein [Candidatus Cloacimonadota bacterium]
MNDNIGISIDYMRFGWFYTFKGDYNRAIEYYREAIRINPDDAAAHYNLGSALQNLERYDEAEEEYREAIRINPDLAEAHANLSILLLKAKRPEDAKKEFEIAKELFEKQGREADVKKMEELLANTQEAG